jgi:hypothetical protein
VAGCGADHTPRGADRDAQFVPNSKASRREPLVQDGFEIRAIESVHEVADAEFCEVLGRDASKGSPARWDSPSMIAALRIVRRF